MARSSRKRSRREDTVVTVAVKLGKEVVEVVVVMATVEYVLEMHDR